MTENERVAALAERERCIRIILDFAELLGDSFYGKPRHALKLAIEMIECDDDCPRCKAIADAR